MVAALVSTPAVADAADAVLESRGSPFTGSLRAQSLGFKTNTSIGQTFCDAGAATGVVQRSRISGPTRVGRIESIAIGHGRSGSCADAIAGVSDCRYQFADLPYAIAIAPARNAFALRLEGVSFAWQCIAFGFVPFECRYVAPELSGTASRGRGLLNDVALLTRDSPRGCLDQIAVEWGYALTDGSGDAVTVVPAAKR